MRGRIRCVSACKVLPTANPERVLVHDIACLTASLALIARVLERC